MPATLTHPGKRKNQGALKKNRARLKAAGGGRMQGAPHAGGPKAAMTENSDARTDRRARPHRGPRRPRPRLSRACGLGRCPPDRQRHHRLRLLSCACGHGTNPGSPRGIDGADAIHPSSVPDHWQEGFASGWPLCNSDKSPLRVLRAPEHPGHPRRLEAPADRDRHVQESRPNRRFVPICGSSCDVDAQGGRNGFKHACRGGAVDAVVSPLQPCN